MTTKREGFNVTVDNRKVWCVLRKQTGPHWHATFWFKGKMYWRATKTPNYAAAETLARLSLVPNAIMGVSRDTLTLRAAIDKCVDARWPTPESHNEHRKVTLINLNNFAKFTGEDTNLCTLSFDSAIDAVQNFVEARKKLVAPRTVLNEQRKLSRLFAWLIKKRLVSWRVNPASMRHLELDEVPVKVRESISEKEVVKMMKAARKTTIWPSVMLCVAAGLRPIGTVRLKWSDVNFETGKIRVYEKRRERRIKVNKWILSELKEWKKTSAGETVVDLKDRTIHYWMNKIRTEQRLRPEATLQGCRRTFISNGMDAGVSSEMMASYGGTSGRTMERHYKDLRTMKSDHVTDIFDYSKRLRNTKVGHSKNHSKKTG